MTTTEIKEYLENYTAKKAIAEYKKKQGLTEDRTLVCITAIEDCIAGLSGSGGIRSDAGGVFKDAPGLPRSADGQGGAARGSGRRYGTSAPGVQGRV